MKTYEDLGRALVAALGDPFVASAILEALPAALYKANRQRYDLGLPEHKSLIDAVQACVDRAIVDEFHKGVRIEGLSDYFNRYQSVIENILRKELFNT